MKTLTQAAVTPGQLKQITRAGQDAVEKAVTDFDLDKEGAQRVHEHGDEFAEAIRNAVTASLKDLSVTNKFKNEEVPSEYGYLSGYKPKSLAEQCNCLRGMFPGLGFANMDLVGQIEKGEVPLPANAEGWFAVPNPKMFKTYSEAVSKVLDLIRQTRNGRFYNYREGEIDERHLRQSERSKKFWEKLSKTQRDPDILIVPAQFGVRHRGRSVRRAREVFSGNEFGLGAFAVGIMLLTHPERLQDYNDLWVDCPGDEFSPRADGDFSESPCFRQDDDRVEFGANGVSNANDDYGSASGFGPQ